MMTVNRLPGCENRIGMTICPTHSSTLELDETLSRFFEWDLKP